MPFPIKRIVSQQSTEQQQSTPNNTAPSISFPIKRVVSSTVNQPAQPEFSQQLTGSGQAQFLKGAWESKPMGIPLGNVYDFTEKVNPTRALMELLKPGLDRLTQNFAGVKIPTTREEIEATLSKVGPAVSKGTKFAKAAGGAAPHLAAALPFFKGAGLLAQGMRLYPIIGTAGGGAAYEATSALIEGNKPEDIGARALIGAGSAAMFHGLGKIGATVIPKKIPSAERIGSALAGYAAGKMLSPRDEEGALFYGALGGVLPFKRSELSPKFKQKTASRLVNSLIKPRRGEFNWGRDPGLEIAKQGLVSKDLPGLLAKVQKRSGDIMGQIDRIISDAQAKVGGADYSDALRIIDEAINKSLTSPLSNKIVINRLQEIMFDLKGQIPDPNNIGGVIQIRPIDFTKLLPREALEVKRQLKTMTDWANPDYNARKIVNNTLRKVYHKIGTKLAAHVDKGLPPGKTRNLRNLMLSESNLITAESSIKRRISAMQNVGDLYGTKLGLAFGSIIGLPTGTSLQSAIIGGLVEKTLTSPAVRTKVAAMLMGQPLGAKAALYRKYPGLEAIINKSITGIKKIKPGATIEDVSGEEFGTKPTGKGVKIPAVIKNYLRDEYGTGELNDNIGRRVMEIVNRGEISPAEAKFIADTIIATDISNGGMLETRVSDAYDNPTLRAKTRRQISALNNFRKTLLKSIQPGVEEVKKKPAEPVIKKQFPPEFTRQYGELTFIAPWYTINEQRPLSSVGTYSKTPLQRFIYVPKAKTIIFGAGMGERHPSIGANAGVKPDDFLRGGYDATNNFIWFRPGDYNPELIDMLREAHPGLGIVRKVYNKDFTDPGEYELDINKVLDKIEFPVGYEPSIKVLVALSKQTKNQTLIQVFQNFKKKDYYAFAREIEDTAYNTYPDIDIAAPSKTIGTGTFQEGSFYKEDSLSFTAVGKPDRIRAFVSEVGKSRNQESVIILRVHPNGNDFIYHGKLNSIPSIGMLNRITSVIAGVADGASIRIADGEIWIGNEKGAIPVNRIEKVIREIQPGFEFTEYYGTVELIEHPRYDYMIDHGKMYESKGEIYGAKSEFGGLYQVGRQVPGNIPKQKGSIIKALKKQKPKEEK